MSPRKVRLVIDSVRGLMVTDAESRLPFIKKHATRPVLKLLKSAMANAEHNFKLKSDRLFIKDIRADQGPTLDRWTMRAHGRGVPIRKRTTHITIILDDISQKGEKGVMKVTPVTDSVKKKADAPASTKLQRGEPKIEKTAAPKLPASEKKLHEVKAKSVAKQSKVK